MPVSQRSIVKIVHSFREFQAEQVRVYKSEPSFTEMLYERDFPGWFLTHARTEYRWNWMRILMDLRNGQFYFPSGSYFSDRNITGKYLSHNDALILGETLIRALAAVAATLDPAGEFVKRSLELDGFAVNEEKLTLVPLEGPVSAQQEEDRLSALVKNTGLPNREIILKHMADGNGLYTEGKNHASVNEFRNMVQALIDGISEETDKHGGHSTGLGSRTKNRVDYLENVNFLTPDEKAALASAWGLLSAGSHPGLPDRELARISLVLALEFGQLLMLKFTNWKSNGHRAFS